MADERGPGAQALEDKSETPKQIENKG